MRAALPAAKAAIEQLRSRLYTDDGVYTNAEISLAFDLSAVPAAPAIEAGTADAMPYVDKKFCRWRQRCCRRPRLRL